MARRAEWSELPKHLTDDVMNIVVPQGTYDQIPDTLTEWYSGLCTGLSLPVPDHDKHDKQLAEVVERCKGIPTAQERVSF
jgi:hypothetical protein